MLHIPIALDDNKNEKKYSTMLDQAYSKLGQQVYRNKPLLFSQGWGDANVFSSIHSWDAFRSTPDPVQINWQGKSVYQDQVYCREANFISAFDHTSLALETRRACFRIVLPEKNFSGPLYIHLAASGDEGFEYRYRTMALPLARKGIASIILENPFFGQRRPAKQHKVRLRFVSDLLLLGALAVQDVRALLWNFREKHQGLIGVTGISMGGHLTALAAALCQEKIAVVPCLAPHSGAAVFVDGLTAKHIDWQRLAVEAGGMKQARTLLRQVLEFTSIENLPKPSVVQAVRGVSARHDGFVPWSSSLVWQRHWQQTSFLSVRGGHVKNILLRKKLFQQLLFEAMQSLKLSLA